MIGSEFRSLVEKNLELFNLNAYDGASDNDVYNAITRGLQQFTAEGFLLAGSEEVTSSSQQISSSVFFPRTVTRDGNYLRKMPLEYVLRFTTTGAPTLYAVQHHSIVLAPIPDQSYTYKLFGFTTHSPVTSGSIIELPDTLLEDAAFYVAANIFSRPHLNSTDTKAFVARLQIIEQKLAEHRAQALRSLDGPPPAPYYNVRRVT